MARREAKSPFTKRGSERLQGAVWAALDARGTTATWRMADLAAEFGHREGVRKYVARLVRGGWVVVDHAEPGVVAAQPVQVYRLARRSREAPRLRDDGSPQPERATETLWRTMKLLRRFTARQLHDAATIGGRAIAVSSVKRYVAHLTEARVLGVMPGRNERNETTYRLVNNVGAAAPQVVAAHRVWDPNRRCWLIDGASA